MRWWSAVAAAVVVVVQVVEAARILMLAPIVSTSHGIFFTGIAEALAARNHTVSVQYHQLALAWWWNDVLLLYLSVSFDSGSRLTGNHVDRR